MNTQTQEQEVSGTFRANTDYSISGNMTILKEALLIPRGSTVVRKDYTGEYTLTYKPFDEFKRRTFECTKVDYNSAGRLCKLTFKEFSKNY